MYLSFNKEFQGKPLFYRGGRFQLPEEVYQPFSSVSLVVQAIRTGQTCFQVFVLRPSQTRLLRIS